MLKILTIWLISFFVCMPAWATEQLDEVVQTGAFNLKLTMIEVGGEEAAGAAEVAVDPNEPMSFEIYVPDNYQADPPAGLMVYVSPTPWGKIPRRWKKVLDEQNMLWIAAVE